MEKALTLKQIKFADEYLKTGNATEAANCAYKPKNRNTAHAIGAENLRKPTIKRFIEESLEENGLNIQLIAQSLVEDIKNKPMNRATELLLASKLLGLLDRSKQEGGSDKKSYEGQSVTGIVITTIPEELREKHHLEDTI
jgi:hypothetical protein